MNATKVKQSHVNKDPPIDIIFATFLKTYQIQETRLQ